MCLILTFDVPYTPPSHSFLYVTERACSDGKISPWQTRQPGGAMKQGLVLLVTCWPISFDSQMKLGGLGWNIESHTRRFEAQPASFTYSTTLPSSHAPPGNDSGLSMEGPYPGALISTVINGLIMGLMRTCLPASKFANGWRLRKGPNNGIPPPTPPSADAVGHRSDNSLHSALKGAARCSC